MAYSICNSTLMENKMITDNTPKIYLSRRNLMALLSKLDRDAAGESTYCSIIKYQQLSPHYKQTMKVIMVTAVQDEDYYTDQARSAGEMHPDDEKNLPKPTTGISGPPIF